MTEASRTNVEGSDTAALAIQVVELRDRCNMALR
jgi:hypothetical protein